MLSANGLTVDLVDNSTAATRDYSRYKLIIIGSETGRAYEWNPQSAVSMINGSGHPILGLGFGGSSFFYKLGLFMGWGQGWLGNEYQTYVVDTAHQIFTSPTKISVPADRIITLYNSSSGQIGIYMPSPVADVIPLGREIGDSNHYSLMQQSSHYFLWGFNDSPVDMTQTGKDLFINVVLWLMR